MFVRLFLAFSIIPLIELYILLKVGSLIGPLPTIALVIVTASGGAYLAKRQGFSTITRIRELLSTGVVPGDEIIDGILIFVAAVLLLTPGLLTDTAGLLLLIPFTRKHVREAVKKRVSGRFTRRW